MPEGIKLGKDSRQALDTNLAVISEALDSISAGPGLSDNSVTNAKLRDSAGVAVIGKFDAGTGDPADIVSSADGQVLQRAGGIVKWDTIPRFASIDPATLSPYMLIDAEQDDANFNDNDAVGTAKDWSGNSRDLTQATAAKKPTFKTGIIN